MRWTAPKNFPIQSEMERALLLLSGGLDSVVSAGLARRHHQLVLALTFDYGQRARRQEMAAARYFCDRWDIRHEVVALPWLAECTTTALVNAQAPLPQYGPTDLADPRRQTASATSVWVPNRNGLFINIAAVYAERHKTPWIVTGFNAEEAVTFPDNSATFVERVNAALAYSTLVQPHVVSFTQSLTKTEVVRKARTLEIPLDRCWSCYEGGEKMCGTCESCVRFQTALRNFGT